MVGRAQRSGKRRRSFENRRKRPTTQSNATDNADPVLMPMADFTRRSATRWAPETEHKSAVFDPATQQHAGVVLASRWARFAPRRRGKVKDGFLLRPGDDVQLTFPTAGTPPKGISDAFTVVDFYESKMSEYDSTCVFVPMRKLQELRGMIDPSSGIAYVSTIRIKLRRGANGNAIRDRLRAATHRRTAALSGEHLLDRHLARQARPAFGRGRNGNGDPQHPVVPDHRRGRLWHSGDVLHDRRREDARHRHPQVPRRVGVGRGRHLPRLRPVAGLRRRGRGAGDRAWSSCATSTKSRAASNGSPAARSSTRRFITFTRFRRSSVR